MADQDDMTIQELMAAAGDDIGWLPSSVDGFLCFHIPDSISAEYGLASLTEIYLDSEGDGVYVIRRPPASSQTRNLRRVAPAMAHRAAEPIKATIDLMPLRVNDRDATFMEMCALVALKRAEARGDLEMVGRLERHLGRAADEVSLGCEHPDQISALTIRCNHHPISKVTQELCHPALRNGDVVELTSGKPGCYTKMSLTWRMPEEVELSRPITEQHKGVIAAVSTICAEAPGQTFGVRKVCEAMGIKNPTKKRQDDTLRLMYELASVYADIDISREAKARGSKLEEAHLREPLLVFRMVRGRAANGYEMAAIQMLAAPVTYRAALALGQVITFPHYYLDFGNQSKTETNQALQRLVIERALEFKRPNSKLSDRIRLVRNPKHPEREIEIERAGVDVSDRDARRRAEGYIKSVLDGLVGAGEISRYAVLNEAGFEPLPRERHAYIRLYR